MEKGTKIGQSGPVKTFSSTAEAISAQIESDTSLNSHVSIFIFKYSFSNILPTVKCYLSKKLYVCSMLPTVIIFKVKKR